MTQVGEMFLADGTSVLLEVSEQEADGFERVSNPAELAQRTSQTLQDALAHLRPALDAVVGGVRDLARTPDTVRVEFGIKLAAEAGVVVAKAASEANFAVSVEWRGTGS